MSIRDKVVAVTGGTSGVGRGIAVDFARRGAKVVATGRGEAAGRELEREVRADGGSLEYVQADVTVGADNRRFVEAAVHELGCLDVLICDAGTVGSPAVVPTADASLEWWNEIVTTNLTGTFQSCQAALRQMSIQGSGTILGISSMNAEVPFSRMSAYNASKAGLTQLIKTIAIEHAPYGIRENTVILGAVAGGTNTAVNESILNHASGGKASEDQLRANAEINAALEESPERIGAALALLLSDDLAMNTANIHLDRGIAAGMLTDLSINMMVSGQWSLSPKAE